MKKFEHLMFDIETMGNESFSAIVSIAAIEFDIKTGEIGQQFYQRINLQSSIDIGLKMSPSTVLWWLQQDKAAQQALLQEPLSDIKDVLMDLSYFCKNGNYITWGRSPRFDQGILEDAYVSTKTPLPWDFRKERCVRTMEALRPEIKANTTFVGVKHNPLDDCKHQIKYCSAIWKEIYK